MLAAASCRSRSYPRMYRPQYECCHLHAAPLPGVPEGIRGLCALQVTQIHSDALFILLVEKDAAFMRLAEDRFYNTYPCIILTAKGQPDVATRYMQLLAHAAAGHALSAFLPVKRCQPYTAALLPVIRARSIHPQCMHLPKDGLLTCAA